MISSHVKIWYPHKWRYRWFHWCQVCSLKLYLNSLGIIETSSGLPRKSSAIFGNLQTSLEIFGNSWKMFGNVRLALGTILENLRKSSENHQNAVFSSKIWILCSRGKNNISLVRCAHWWDIVLATRTRHRVISSIYGISCLYCEVFCLYYLPFSVELHSNLKLHQTLKVKNIFKKENIVLRLPWVNVNKLPSDPVQKTTKICSFVCL